MNHPRFHCATTEQSLSLRLSIDGADLLEGYRNDRGRDPDDLLPPLSSLLLPSREGHGVIIGVCSCGESGCGSLAVSIRRDGDDVVWDAIDRAGSETLDRSYRFDLREYLDAVDDAAGDRPAEEGIGRRVARMVRLRLGM